MEVKKTIVMTEKEYIDLCEFLEWAVRNPNICNNCPHFASWEKIACCGCLEQTEYVKTYESMPGYETSKNEELQEFCEAYKAHVKASMRFQAARREYEEARIALSSAKEKLDGFNKEITLSDIHKGKEEKL